ncbi:MAG: Spy/CpxP family protein refolding chaperone [Chromatiaceae bacterium]|nr:Spy/CpxP family protein refolding chaperone [Chromatiaceae bacterium]
MRTMIKRTVLVTSLFAAGSLLAYGPGFGGFGFPGHHGWGGHMTGMTYGPMAFLDGDAAVRLDSIKAELAITPAQESAWSRFADSVKVHADTARTAYEGSGWRSGASFLQQELPLMWQQRQAVHEAASDLVSVLDETQQRRAEGLISYGMQHPF